MKQAKLKWHVITKYPAFYQLRTIIGSNWVTPPPPKGSLPPKRTSEIHDAISKSVLLI